MSPNRALKNTPEGVFNPFPGLRPFTAAEHHLFFGREGQSEEVLKKLAAHQFVAVVGASGSGKSSLIYCGVIPELHKGAVKSAGTEWNVLSMRPGNDPIGNMTRALARNLLSKEDPDLDQSITESVLRKDPSGLTKALKHMDSDKESNTLIVIDQFEELFRFKASRMSDVGGKDSLLFVNLLVQAIHQSRLPVYVILTMRSDFIGECSQYLELTDLINASNYLVPQMDREAYRKVIRGPLEVVHTPIQDELVEQVLDELGDNPDQLPVLQHVMMRTWSYWYELNDLERPINISDYEAVGKLEGALSQHADEAFEELDSKQKEYCESLFKTITEKGNDNRGTRLPTRVGVIARIARCTVDDLIPVIDVFRAEGRSFLTPAAEVPLSEDSVIDISHESLMRIWDRLKVWVDEEAAAVQMYLRLTEASEMYMEGKTGLWRPPDLQLAINWRDEAKPNTAWAERINPAFERALVYLNTSEKEYLAEEENKVRMQKRQLKRSRIMALVLGSAAIISLGFMILFFMQQMEAESERQRAIEQEERAKQEAERALEQQKLAEQKSQEALEAQEAAMISAREAQDERERALLQEKRATENAVRAQQQQQLAEEKSQEAQEAQSKAEQSAEEAERERQEALRLRMVSTAKTMAIKSAQMQTDIDLKTLLAYQAYLFHEKYQGAMNDPDIYTGLYEVAKYYGSSNYRNFIGHHGKVSSIVFNPQTEQFYTTGDDGKVLAWSVRDTGYTEVYQSNAIGELLAVSPDGKYLAFASSTQAGFRIIPLSGDRQIRQMNQLNQRIRAMTFSGKQLITSTYRGQVLLWNDNLSQYDSLANPNGMINSLAASPDGSILAGGTQNGDIIIWRGMKDTDPFVLNDESLGPVQVVRFQNDNEILAIGDRQGVLELWNTARQERIEQIQNGHSSRVTDIEFSPDNKQMATSSMDGLVKIWQTNDLTQPPLNFSDNDGYVMALAFGPEGRTLLAGNTGDANLVMRPTRAKYMVDQICSLLSRNFTEDEWRVYVGNDIPYEETCEPAELKIQIREKDRKK